MLICPPCPRIRAPLQLYVYEKHPPKHPSFTLEYLRKLDRGELPPTGGDAAEGSTAAAEEAQESASDMAARLLATKKKVLLKAQRDYHPDRNTGMARETLSYSPMEWEVVCLTVCQQLALVYDKLFKGARKLERN